RVNRRPDRSSPSLSPLSPPSLFPLPLPSALFLSLSLYPLPSALSHSPPDPGRGRGQGVGGRGRGRGRGRGQRESGERESGEREGEPRHVVDGHLDAQVPRLGGACVDDLDLPRGEVPSGSDGAAAEEPCDLVEWALGRGEPDALERGRPAG